MSMSAEVVYLGADNAISLTLSIDGQTLTDHTSITRAVLEFGRGTTNLSAAPYKTIDSSVDSQYFDFTLTNKIRILLGAATISKGRHNVTLTTYMPGYTDGLAFDTELDIKVT